MHPKRHRIPTSCFRSAAIAALALAATASAEIRTFGISQAVQLDQEPPAIRVYLEAVGEERRPIADIDPAQLSATLGEHPLQTRQTYPFQAGGEGVAYVFLIDVSASLSTAEFNLILEALDVWVLSLRPVDRVAVVAFGNESRIVVDFTASQLAIRTALESLGPTDDRTVLHDALQDGLELCSRRDPDLPGRRVIMVLTDGRDEGSALMTDDVLALLRHDPVPIYAIGLSRISNPADRQRYLDLLRRFAANSGGAFHEGSTNLLGSAYEAIRRSIHGVWVADLVCQECRADGEEYRLQVLLDDEGRILSDGRSLRLLPIRRPTSPPGATVPPSDNEAGAEVGSTVPSQESGSDADAASAGQPSGSSGSSRWLWIVPPLLVAAAAAAAWYALRPRRSTSAPAAENGEPLVEGDLDPALPPPGSRPGRSRGTPDPADSQPILPQRYRLDSGVETSRPPRPAVMRMVRLIVVRGSKPGRQYTLTLFKNAVVGSRSTCDCVLAEPGVAPEQFEIFQLDGRVYIKGLSSTQPTLMDGAPISDQQPLKSGALVGNRDFIVRIAYEEARPINT